MDEKCRLIDTRRGGLRLLRALLRPHKRPIGFERNRSRQYYIMIRKCYPNVEIRAFSAPAENSLVLP